MKIILNKNFGGFHVSTIGYYEYAKRKNIELYRYEAKGSIRDTIYTKTDSNVLLPYYFTKDFGNNVTISDEDYEKYNLRLDEEYREDKTLIEIIEEFSDKASGELGSLKVVEIPDNSFYVIDNYDGVETIYYSESEIMEK